MLKVDPILISDKLYALFNIIWANEVLPAEWLKGLIVKLSKERGQNRMYQLAWSNTVVCTK